MTLRTLRSGSFAPSVLSSRRAGALSFTRPPRGQSPSSGSTRAHRRSRWLTSWPAHWSCSGRWRCSEQGSLDSLDRAADDAERVVLAAGTEPGDAWTDVCLREADLILAVTSGHPSANRLQRSAALSGCELLVTGDRLAAGALEVLAPARDADRCRPRSPQEGDRSPLAAPRREVAGNRSVWRRRPRVCPSGCARGN